MQKGLTKEGQSKKSIILWAEESSSPLKTTACPPCSNRGLPWHRLSWVKESLASISCLPTSWQLPCKSMHRPLSRCAACICITAFAHASHEHAEKIFLIFFLIHVRTKNLIGSTGHYKAHCFRLQKLTVLIYSGQQVCIYHMLYIYNPSTYSYMFIDIRT